MPPIVARTIGGPGAGKTTRALEILEMVLERVIRDPMKVGFVSFTRAARREASSRAASKFGLRAADLEKHGWFRTLHSACYHCLGVSSGELLTGENGDNEWLKISLGDPKARLPDADGNDDYFVVPAAGSDSGRALSLWDTARSRQCPLQGVWALAHGSDSRLPAFSICCRTIERYEAAKARDGRLDFTDLLMRFAGRRWSGDHRQPFEQTSPQGDFPILPVFFHDEAQDCSLLTSLVFNRLTRHSQFVYLMGDDRQAIFNFCGSDGSIFASTPAAKEEVLPISYRCDEAILTLADSIIERSHPRRAFAPANAGGEIVRRKLEDALAAIKPGVDTLLLARTNEQARAIAASLDDNLIPWKPTKGNGGFAAPARAAGVAALLALERGDQIDGEGFRRLLDLLPSRKGDTTLFERGTKSYFDDQVQRQGFLPTTLATCDCAGATEAFKQIVSSGKWLDLLEAPAARLARAARKHGTDAVANPAARVGTIHSAKGMESDEVVLVNDLPYPVQQAILEKSGLEEERRLWYVGITRARHKLTIGGTAGTPFPEL